MEKTSLRIIGGDMRSRKLQFTVDPRTRPMKDRTREAVMNLLGSTFGDSIAFDLFAGTGVLAFEAISRGATRAVLFDVLAHGVLDIRKNCESLGIKDKVVVLQKDVIRWSETLEQNLSFLRLDSVPWIVFCCPPYALWETQGEALKSMLSTWIEKSPAGSLYAVELEDKTPLSLLPTTLEWDIRNYKPAKMAIAEKT
ncbi:RsmD family RNA methyltransferase [Pirellulaceae bacterium SH449]